MRNTILRKPLTQAELDEIRVELEHMEHKLAVMKASRDVPWRDIEALENEIDANRRRYNEMRKGVAA